ncbi:MAG: hydantoinase B/oxoprolinase family protein [Thermoplasmataceae archaeon]|jgi:N-methylhydantoinase B
MEGWEIIGKGTQFIAEEMAVALKRSAISPNIRERMDHSCAVTDSKGNIVAQAENIPVHLGSFRTGVSNILNYLSKEGIKLEHGDMVITNDPYISGTHMNDVMFMAPVFHEGSLVSYIVNKAHNVDVGGPSFGSLNPQAKNLYQEGFVIPPVKIVKGGVLDREILSFIYENFKDPETAEGDLKAQMSANLTGAKRVNEMLDNYGHEHVLTAWADVINHSRNLTLHDLSSWPLGEFSSEDFLEAEDKNLLIKLKLKVSRSGIVADFTGTSEQIEFPLNAVIGVTYSATAFAIRASMKEDIPTNEGFYSVLDIVVPQGTILNPNKPYPVAGGNVETTQRIADVTLHALSNCLSGRIPSASSGTMFNVMMGGKREKTGYWSYYETIGGGNGASRMRNGQSGIHSNMTNTLNTPIEIAEREYPFFFTSYCIRRNSGGRGFRKGGDGIIRSFIVTRDCEISVIADRFRIKPYALENGESGKPGAIFIKRNGRKRRYGSKFSESLKKGDEVIILTPGGSGYGKKRKAADLKS